MKRSALLFFLLLGLIANMFAASDTLQVLQTSDFKVNGKGSDAAWEKTPWVNMQNSSPGIASYSSQFKILYSEKGIYVLMEGDDQKITTTYKKDFDDLYKGDVFEVFFHPNPKEPVYFEYEINALNKELVLVLTHLEYPPERIGHRLKNRSNQCDDFSREIPNEKSALGVIVC